VSACERVKNRMAAGYASKANKGKS